MRSRRLKCKNNLKVDDSKIMLTLVMIHQDDNNQDRMCMIHLNLQQMETIQMLCRNIGVIIMNLKDNNKKCIKGFKKNQGQNGSNHLLNNGKIIQAIKDHTLRLCQINKSQELNPTRKYRMSQFLQTKDIEMRQFLQD